MSDLEVEHSLQNQLFSSEEHYQAAKGTTLPSQGFEKSEVSVKDATFTDHDGVDDGNRTRKLENTNKLEGSSNFAHLPTPGRLNHAKMFLSFR